MKKNLQQVRTASFLPRVCELLLYLMLSVSPGGALGFERVLIASLSTKGGDPYPLYAALSNGFLKLVLYFEGKMLVFPKGVGSTS